MTDETYGILMYVVGGAYCLWFVLLMTGLWYGRVVPMAQALWEKIYRPGNERKNMTELEEKLHLFVDQCMEGTEEFLDPKQIQRLQEKLHEEATAIGQPTIGEEASA